MKRRILQHVATSPSLHIRLNLRFGLRDSEEKHAHVWKFTGELLREGEHHRMWQMHINQDDIRLVFLYLAAGLPPLSAPPPGR